MITRVDPVPAAADDRRAAGVRLRWSPRVAELGLVFALVLFAGMVRWTDFLYEPAFTDEAREVMRGALIAQGRLQTLTNVDSYIGSLHNYLLAAWFLLFGQHVWLPRAWMVVAGALTTVAAYLLGREWGGRLAGALAALLLATNAVHVLVSSHIAWSNGLTPLFTTLAIWQLARAVRRSQATALAWSGALFGVAMHTHPVAVVILPGCAVYLLWKGRGLLRTRWAWIGASLFIVGNLPIIAHNVATGFETFQSATYEASRREAGPLEPDDYLENVGDYALQLVRAVASSIDRRGSLAAYLLDPLMLLWLGLGLVALVVLSRRGNPLPLLVMLSALLTSALFSANSFEPIPSARYLMPAVVVVLAAIGTFLASLPSLPASGPTALPPLRGVHPRAKRRAQGSPPETEPTLGFGSPPTPTLSRSLALSLFVLLALPPLAARASYEDPRPVDNRGLIEAAATLEAVRDSGEVVLLDRRLSDRHGPEGVRLAVPFEMLLSVRGVPYRYSSLEPWDIRDILARRPSQLAVLDATSIPRLRDRFALTRLAPLDLRATQGDYAEHAVFRIAAPR